MYGACAAVQRTLRARSMVRSYLPEALDSKRAAGRLAILRLLEL